VSEAVEVRSMGISFCTELQEKIASRRLVIEHLENVGATSGWVMRLKRDQEDDVSLLGLLDTFVHRMYEIVRKREKDLQMLACKCKLQMLACKCLLANACLQMLAANASCICRLQMLACKCKLHMQAANACLQMLAANASCICRLQMQAAYAGCKCLLANACLQMLACKCLLQMQAAYAGCKCLLANACCKCKRHMQAANACLQMQKQAANSRCKF
ncbi:hypothetical protein Tco_0222187, partial [Tanacetum coccineum]